MRTMVGVLRGGKSSEYDISLQSGASVLAELNREKYDARDIFIDKNGIWHVHGVAVSPDKALRGVDVAFNTLHGEFGEDGRIQRMLDVLDIPYTGARPFASSLAFNKVKTKEAVEPLGITVARNAVVSAADDISSQAFSLFRSFPMPAIIKPVTGGSSVGTSLAKDLPSLEKGLRAALEVSPRAMVEEFIKGREATVGVIDQFRGEKTYALFPVEIVPPPSSPFFDYEAKYSGKSLEICPGNFTVPQKEKLMAAAKRVHEGLGLDHYSRSDFIVSPRGIYFLEVNSAAAIGLTEQSLFPKSLRAVGSKLSEFIDHVISLALLTHKK